MGALSHIRVLDMSRVLAGPWCSQTLSDLGAEVIKIERPGRGDDTRGWGPPFLPDDEGKRTSESAYFLSTNRGKKSVAINIASPEGQALIRELAAEVDVLIENYKQGDLAKYGLDYETLAKINPGLVYCSITGFGQYGTRAKEPGYDFMIQGACGFMTITGERADLPGGGPQKSGIALADFSTGLYSAIAIQAALLSRTQTGKGQYIDMALFDTMIALLANQEMNYFSSGVIPMSYGNASANIVPYQVFKSKDREFIIACGNDTQFAALCEAIGLPELATNPKFNTNAQRIANRNELIDDIFAKHFLTKTTDEWVAIINAAKVPVGPINNIEQALNEPQTKERELVIEMEHPFNKKLKMVGCPIKLSGTPIEYKMVPPLLGQHTEEVLKQYLNLDDDRIAELKQKGVIDLKKD